MLSTASLSEGAGESGGHAGVSVAEGLCFSLLSVSVTFLVATTKSPETQGSNLWTGLFLPRSVLIQSIMVEKSWQQELEAAACIITNSEEAEASALLNCLSPFYSVQGPRPMEGAAHS